MCVCVCALTTKPGLSCKSKFCVRSLKRNTSHFDFHMNVCIIYWTSIK